LSLVAVGSGKGSPGCTFVSINLAASLSSLGQHVLLMDVDPHGGDLTAYLGLDPRRGLHPLTRMHGANGSEALLKEADPRGERVLCLGGFPRSGDVDLEVIPVILESAVATGRTVVADLGRVNFESAGVFSSADLILIAVRPDLIGVYGAQRAIDDLHQAGIPPAKIAAVITGWEHQRPADLAESAKALKARAVGAIPLDRRHARKALAAQQPLHQGPAVKAFYSLASEVSRILARTPTSRKVGAQWTPR
jgi:MinD-like ATPase involved in chromosome partitioning or flagellar assembly